MFKVFFRQFLSYNLYSKWYHNLASQVTNCVPGTVLRLERCKNLWGEILVLSTLRGRPSGKLLLCFMLKLVSPSEAIIGFEIIWKGEERSPGGENPMYWRHWNLISDIVTAPRLWSLGYKTSTKACSGVRPATALPGEPRGLPAFLPCVCAEGWPSVPIRVLVRLEPRSTAWRKLDAGKLFKICFSEIS